MLRVVLLAVAPFTFVKRTIYKALAILTDSSSFTCVLCLIISVIYFTRIQVLFHNDFSLTRFEKNIGTYEYSSIVATSRETRFGYFYDQIDTSFYQDFNADSRTAATSCGASFGFFCLGSSTFEASFQDHQHYYSKWWLIPYIKIRQRFPPRSLSVRQARRAGSKKWKRRRDRFLKGYEDGTTAVDSFIEFFFKRQVVHRF